MQGRKQSIQQRLAIVFTVVIVCIILISLFLYVKAVSTIREETYEKMSVQAEYCQEILEMGVRNSLTQQLEFFNNRRLVFLGESNSGISAYDERESVLDIQERIWIITESNNLVQDGILYIPGTEYYISAGIIRRMNQSDRNNVIYYLQTLEDELQYDGQNFYSVRTNTGFTFILFFSSRKIEENLSLFNVSTDGGAFIYNEACDVILENSGLEAIGRRIWENLVKDENGEYEKVQQVRLDNRNYLVFVGENGKLGTFVQYINESSLMQEVNEFWRYAILFLILVIIMSVVFMIYIRKVVHRPLTILVQAFEKLKEGNLKEHIYHNNEDEFAYLYQSFNDMEDSITVPRLIVQPLLENVFEHGLANKVNNGILRVNFRIENEMLYISVEDNGEEVTDEMIADMQEALEVLNPAEVTGMANIYKRLVIYFHGNGRLLISRSSLGGMATNICIPIS